MAYRMTLRSPKGPHGLRKQYKAVRDAALKEAGEFWVNQILPEHFTAGGAAKYRYPARTKAHIRRKSREGKGGDPNVYTGRLRDKMIGMQPRMTMTGTGLKMTWPGLPRYTYVVDTMEWVANDRRWNDEYIKTLPPEAQAGIMKWRQAHPETKDGRFKRVKRPDKVAEITRVNKADVEAVGKTFRTAFLRGIEGITA